MATVQPCTAHQRRVDQAAALRHALRAEIVTLCSGRARTISQLAVALSVGRDNVRRHVHQLLNLGLLTAEAPSRHAGRLVIPYRATPQGQSLVAH